MRLRKKKYNFVAKIDCDGNIFVDDTEDVYEDDLIALMSFVSMLIYDKFGTDVADTLDNIAMMIIDACEENEKNKQTHLRLLQGDEND